MHGAPEGVLDEDFPDSIQRWTGAWSRFCFEPGNERTGDLPVDDDALDDDHADNDDADHTGLSCDDCAVLPGNDRAGISCDHDKRSADEEADEGAAE